MDNPGRLKDFWKTTASRAGGLGRKGLETLIPDEVLQNSLFIGGFYEMARNLETLTEEGEEGGESKRFFLKKGGGQVMDLATTPLTGLPISMWSALISDGCRVSSWTLKTAVESSRDQDLMFTRVLSATAGGIEHTGELSRSVFRFFDTPGKEEAQAMVASSRELMEYTLKNSGALGKEAVSNAEELYRLATELAESSTDRRAQEEFMERTGTMVEALAEKAGDRASDLVTFINSPNKRNFVVLSLGLQRSFTDVPLALYRETALNLKRFPDLARRIPRADKELAAMAGIIKGLSKETSGRFAGYLEHYKGIFRKG